MNDSWVESAEGDRGRGSKAWGVVDGLVKGKGADADGRQVGQCEVCCLVFAFSRSWIFAS